MTGMGGTLGSKSPYVTARFNGALWHQLVIVTLVVLIVALAAALVLRRRHDAVGASDEPGARKLLRIGFGALWIIAGLLQLQPQMPIGLPTQVISPAAASAPGWVADLVNFGTEAWLRHPVTAAAAVVWLQLGLGLWLLFADRGRLSRLAGAASAGWALGIWIFGNALGGIFVAPISWMTGAPGATLFYFFAGVALALPEAWLRRRSIVLWSSRAFGALLAALALLQAWPGRGFWSGGSSKDPGAIAAMARSMGSVAQPRLTSSLQAHLASLSLGGSWLINLVVVAGLGFAGVAFLSARRTLVPMGARVYLVLALLDWVVVQDLGIFGGVATDVNSMVPSAIVALALWTAVVQLEAEPALAPAAAGAAAPLGRRVAALSAAAVFVVGALPMAALALLPGSTADAAEASGGGVASVSLGAPGFTLTDQHGRQIQLSSLRGHRVVLAFLDPVCTTDCPIEAQQMLAASRKLGANSGTVFLAVNANPLYLSQSALKQFDEEEGLAGWDQWHFLTGSRTQLERVWHDYGVTVEVTGSGSMVTHTEPFYVIDAKGRVRSTWDSVTGTGVGSPLGDSGTALIVAQVEAAQ
jgi:cytochrome oxidase Cu insertion factor (SCO1/SenC/PrrC family)